MLETAMASRRVFQTLITLGGAPVNAAPSVGSAEQLELFSAITNGPIAPVDPEVIRVAFGADSTSLPVKVAGIVGQIESTVAKYGVPLSIALLTAWCVLAVGRRRLDPSLVVALALAAAVGTRVVLLGLLEATSIPSNNMLYLSPVVPMTLMLIPVVFVGFFDMALRRQSQPQEAGSSESV